MSALTNHSMLEDERLNYREKLQKQYRKKSFGGMYGTVGHVFTVMVEVLEIKQPFIATFITTLNKYIEIGGNGFACVSKPTDKFYSRTTNKLAHYLRNEFPDITKEQFNAIMKAAYPPHPY